MEFFFFFFLVKIIILLARGIICKIVANILFIICHGKKFLKLKYYSIYTTIVCIMQITLSLFEYCSIKFHR